MKNPYDPPPAVSDEPTRSDQLKAPAIALIVVSIIALVLGVLGVIADIVILCTGVVEQLEALDQGPVSKYTIITFRAVWGVILVIASSFVLYGALKMLKRTNYGTARMASVVAMIPLVGPCCILGIPFGFWAYVILAKSEVKKSFRNTV